MVRRGITAIVALVVAFLAIWFSQRASMLKEPIILERSRLLALNQVEHYLGNPAAPVVLMEYASFSCDHCAVFANKILPAIKEKYIRTGKVLFIFRDFPIDLFGFKASMVAHCHAPGPNDPKFFEVYSHLFRTTDEWSYKANYLETLFVISKTTREAFEACVNNEELENMLLKHKLEANQMLGIKAVPSLIINGKLYEGSLSFEDLSKLIDEALAEVARPKQESQRELNQ